MDYKVILSDLAKRQLDDILFYIYATLGNEVAAARVLENAPYFSQNVCVWKDMRCKYVSPHFLTVKRTGE